jgi:hypothetical protein
MYGSSVHIWHRLRLRITGFDGGVTQPSRLNLVISLSHTSERIIEHKLSLLNLAETWPCGQALPVQGRVPGESADGGR